MKAKLLLMIFVQTATTCYGQWQRQELTDAMTDKRSVVYQLPTGSASDTPGVLSFSCDSGKTSAVSVSLNSGTPFQRTMLLGRYLTGSHGAYTSSFKIRVGSDKPTSLNGDLSPNLLALDVREHKQRMDRWFSAGRLRFETIDSFNDVHVLEFVTSNPPSELRNDCGISE